MKKFPRRDPEYPMGVKMPKQFGHWAQRHGLYFRKGFARTRKRRFAELAEGDTRHFRAFPHINEFAICDGNFDRWANSIGAVAPIPMTQADFDKTLDEMVHWSAVRASRPQYWWLSATYSHDIDDIVHTCPHPVEIAREHRDHLSYTCSDAEEFVSTFPGRSHFLRDTPLVLFERDTDAAMFKLKFG